MNNARNASRLYAETCRPVRLQEARRWEANQGKEMSRAVREVIVEAKRRALKGLNRDVLRKKAQRKNVQGRGKMTKKELIEVLANMI